MKTVIAIRHVPFEDLGFFAASLMAQGYEIQYRDAGVDDLGAIDALAPDLLVVLGGPISANDAADYPFLQDELRLLDGRLHHDHPTLGICLGSQLMARVLGARVYPAAQKEIGWGRLRLTPEGHHSCLQHLAPERTPVLHWHGDTFDLPARAVRLAATDICENQAFRWGRHALALQFHVETTAQGLEQWFIGHTGEIAATPGVSVAQLRADTARWSATCATQGRKCLEAWLQEIAHAAV
jgi:GMP synthase (glutamine-hydrolysing)